MSPATVTLSSGGDSAALSNSQKHLSLSQCFCKLCNFLSFSFPCCSKSTPAVPRGMAPLGSAGKEAAYSARDLGSNPGSGRSPGEGHGNPLQYSCLENLMDRGAWQATVLEVTKSQTRLSDFHFTSGFPNRKPSKSQCPCRFTQPPQVASVSQLGSGDPWCPLP